MKIREIFGKIINKIFDANFRYFQWVSKIFEISRKSGIPKTGNSIIPET